jgi:hypothetical protein
MPRTKTNDEMLVDQMREIVSGTTPMQDAVSVPVSDTERLERIEAAVLALRKDVDELRYLFARLNNAFMNGEIQGYAQQIVHELERRVGHIENYLRYITTGSTE